VRGHIARANSQSTPARRSSRACVAHDFGRRIALDQIKEVASRVQTLMRNTERLVLFVDIEQHCTIETVRRAIRCALPDLTFRVVYPRSIYKMSGMKVILIERRRPRAFLFLSPVPMAGKTETSLFVSHSSGTTAVHGDEYVNEIISGDIAVPKDLRRGIHLLSADIAFDSHLFAQFIDQIPALRRNEDIVFDLLMPIRKHAAVASFFESLGFFPIVCLTPAEQKDLERQRQERLDEAERHRWEIESFKRDAEAHAAYRRRVEGSYSWRLTGPLRSTARRVLPLARSVRSLAVRAAGVLAALL
jgi:hypothetical protein